MREWILEEAAMNKLKAWGVVGTREEMENYVAMEVCRRMEEQSIKKEEEEGRMLKAVDVEDADSRIEGNLIKSE